MVEAEEILLRLHASSPSDAGVIFRLAGLRFQQRRWADSAALFREALEREPGNADAWLNLGVAAKMRGDFEASAASFQQAIHLRPDLGLAHFNLGVLHAQKRRLETALACFDRAIALAPAHAQAHGNRAAMLGRLGRYRESLESCDRALLLAPRYAEAHANRGSALTHLARLDEAAASFQQALDIDPAHALAHHGLGLTLLRLGDYAAGWHHYEHRWRRPGGPEPRHSNIPRWNGAEPVAGKRLLLWAEQGFGDTIQFSRYAPMLASLGADVVLEAQPELVTLLATLGAGVRVVARGDALPACDLQVPTLSLPAAFGTTLATIPAQFPYLQADPGKARDWAARLTARRHSGAAARPRIGIACSGSRGHENDAQRSMPLERFAPLFGRAQLYLLQVECRGADETTLQNAPIHDLRSELRDFSDTAAIVENLDLTISVDTALVHVAGALGRPLRVLLAHDADWRWLTSCGDSSWYPSARLARQIRPGDWDAAIAAALRGLPAGS